MNKLLFFLVIFTLCISACSDGQEDDTPINSDWLIPASQIFDGGPGLDGIPSVDEPKFTSTNEINYMNDDDLIIAFKSGDVIKGYTHNILDWHEIINDNIGDKSIALTYCPLTGTSIAWNRMINGKITTFGVSGLLYNSNIIPYDRETKSNWSQMRLECVNGELSGTKPEVFQVTEMSWATWKEMFPDGSVVTTATGFSRSYGSYPYFNAQGEDYRVDTWLLFPVDPADTRLDSKERVLGVIIAGKAKAYRFGSFTDESITIKEDAFEGKNLIIIGSEPKNFIAAFENNLNLTGLEPSISNNESIMKDGEGNEWNIFGEAISGPRAGQKLNNVHSFMGYWLGWGAFYPDLEIFD